MDNYWIRANPNIGTTVFEGGLNSAILRYRGATRRSNLTPPPRQIPIPPVSCSSKKKDLVPLERPGAPGRPVPGGADVNINFNASNLKFERKSNLVGYSTILETIIEMAREYVAEDFIGKSDTQESNLLSFLCVSGENPIWSTTA
ncbi:hypothetical protein K435DRAFT_848507 [Dendrothele bispora CBS 962.96]|uniref:Uncharacterized protein n=1 Tax=Dendrothele bispora (strain CBS 962.96) TaxID=1314807 RepID=A0A4S8MV77_DENBC|nr:hypothetical protein K435DRAFT_848507 [Dendrothele bispora CBS 962.96]